MLWSVNNALILALDWLASPGAACMELEAAVTRMEGEQLRMFANLRFQWVRRAHAKVDSARLRWLLKAELGLPTWEYA